MLERALATHRQQVRLVRHAEHLRGGATATRAARLEERHALQPVAPVA